MTDEYYAQALADDNVQAIGEGENGQTVIYVRDDSAAAVAPYIARGEGVRIIKCSGFGIGPPYWPESPETRTIRDRMRPAPGGPSVGSYRISAGTLSCYVRDKISGEMVLLSNNHVLANVDSCAVGDDILQPGAADGGQRGSDTIAHLLRWVPIRTDTTRYVDCAIARMRNQGDVNQNIIGLGYPHGVAAPYPGQKLVKTGRTTDTSRGDCVVVNASVKVDYGGFSKTIQDCIVTGVPSAPGDSGSAMLDFGSHDLVGLLFAGGVTPDGYGVTIGCRMDRIEQLLNVEVPPPPEIQRSLWLDISKWQGEIDFGVMKSRGVRGVIVKICQGRTYIDPKFSEYFDAARAAGLLVGGYVFVDPDYNAVEHYNNLLITVGAREFDAPIALDVETGGNVTTLVQSLAAMVSNWQGQKCMIYTSPGFWNEHVNRWSGWRDYPLWVAYWSDRALFPLLPDDWKGAEGQPVMWQYKVFKGGGSYFGVGSPDIDMDTTYPAFEALLTGGGGTPPEMVNLIITIEGSGSVSPGSGQYAKNSTVQFQAVPATGWIFDGWGGDLSGAGNPASLVMDADKSIMARFVQGSGGPAEFVHHKGCTLINAQNYRRGPGTGFQSLGQMPAGTILEIMEEVKDAAGNTWARIGYKEYAAILHNGVIYIEYVMEWE